MMEDVRLMDAGFGESVSVDTRGLQRISDSMDSRRVT
jgi:hypothetical protein